MSTRTLSTNELKDIRAALRDFNFTRVMNLLGWNHATGQSTLSAGDDQFTLKPIAQLGGVQVIEVTSQDNPTTLPLEQTRRALSDALINTAREHVLIFVDAAREQSHWYWVKRELDGNKRKVQPRTHTYIKGQPDDLFIGKLSGLFVDIAELDDNGELPVLEAARRLSTALDSEAVVKRFYNEFKNVRETLAEQISGISDPKDRAWYASVLLNRLMFVYFLQGKGFLGRPNRTSDGDRRYLQHKLAASRTEGQDLYYSTFLHHLFFDAFAKPEDQRSPDTVRRTGQIPYLNGGLFLRHGIELKYPVITIPDAAFDGILDLFGKYTWNLSEDDKHREGLDPDVLGHIFEKYINQKGFGAYYTRPEITEYLCEQTVRKLVLDKIKTYRPADTHLHHNLSDALTSADRDLVRHLLTADDGLKQISLLDPACGSGAFLVAALKTMLDVYTVLMGRIHALHDPTLLDWEARLRGTHASYHYNLKKQIITENLYGVDLMPEAAEIAKLRLFLSLVSSANTLDDLEPLPNIDFNILTGNSLIGLLEVNENAYNAQRNSKAAAMTPLLGVGSVTYGDIVKERQRLLKIYRHRDVQAPQELTALREGIQRQKDTAYETLNALLHKQFHDLGIKYEEVNWDSAKGTESKAKKRALTMDDIMALKPFHWAFEFAEVMERGGFDAVITNPPWDSVKPEPKEFFAKYSEKIRKNETSKAEFNEIKSNLLRDSELMQDWLEYVIKNTIQMNYFHLTPNFSYQSIEIDGKKTGGDLNLYKLFTELSFKLLRSHGYCGIVVPSVVGIALGATALRKMLISKTKILGYFGFENRKIIFEEVDSRFKFSILTFEKDGYTEKFPAAFMRQDVKDLISFPQYSGFDIETKDIEASSPLSLSIPEIKDSTEYSIQKKFISFPSLYDASNGQWSPEFKSGMHTSNDYEFFESYQEGYLPAYEGKMISQYRSDKRPPRYWVNPKHPDIVRSKSRKYIFEGYRFAFRRIARGTDTDSFISSIIPDKAFIIESLTFIDPKSTSELRSLFLLALVNSNTLGFMIRQRIDSNINIFLIKQLSIPKIPEDSIDFLEIIKLSARLVCISPDFDDLAKKAGLRDHTEGVTDDAGRAALRAELDARVAHLYGLSVSEFTHILGTFPLMDRAVKDAALAEFQRLAPPEGDPALVALLQRGEGQQCEFKETFAWDVRKQKAGDYIKAEVFKTVAAFANASGGTLIIGVTDGGKGVGLDADYALRPQQERSVDKFELYLRQQLRDALSPDIGEWLTVSFPAFEGTTVCRVDVEAAPEEIFTADAKLYVRRGNESRQLKGAELAAHVRRRAQRLNGEQ